MGAVYYGWNPHTEIKRPLDIKIAAVISVLGLLLGLFGCSEKTEYPFDTQKAYCYTRGGIIAGGDFDISFSTEGVVRYFSYEKPASEKEGGMKDRGADIYFTGIKAGSVEVTVTYTYPTREPKEYKFTLEVADDLTVTEAN